MLYTRNSKCLHRTHCAVHVQHATLFTQNILCFSHGTLVVKESLHTPCCMTVLRDAQHRCPHCDTMSRRGRCLVSHGSLPSWVSVSHPPEPQQAGPHFLSYSDVLTVFRQQA